MQITPAWVDIVLLALLAISVIVGVLRGFVFEVLSLLGWVVAWFVALWAAPQLAPHLPVGTPGSAMNHGVAIALAFIAALVAWSLASRLVRLLLHATPLSAFDRVLGAAFGLLRGVLLLLALAVVVAMTPLARSQAWSQSQGAAGLNRALHGVKPLLPPDLSQHLPA